MNYRIVEHGAEHEQYFQGHGLAFTHWTHTYTGCGSTPGEALSDALAQAYMSGDVPESLIGDAESCAAAKCIRLDDAEFEAEPLSEDVYFYVSVDFKV